MPSVNDWAAKAARRIKAEIEITRNPRNISEERIAAIIATFAEPILKLLAESRREHRYTVDARRGLGTMAIEGCPKHFYPAGECTCGADEWNAKIDEALNGTS